MDALFHDCSGVIRTGWIRSDGMGREERADTCIIGSRRGDQMPRAQRR